MIFDQHKQLRQPLARRSNTIALFVLTAFVAAGCNGDEDDTGLGFAGGQDPDPVVVDYPIAYVKRPLPVDDQGGLIQGDVRELITFEIGADLFVRERASPTAVETNVTGSITQGLGDVRDVEMSYDGSKVVFAMRATFIEGAEEEDQPTWNIWEYDIEANDLRRVIVSDISAEAGHDVAPHYLPDGRIVFSSTRQRQSKAILLDESKEQFAALDEDRNEMAFVLHVMNADGSDVHQVSFNQSHDLDPSVLESGQVVFSRWDHMGGRNGVHLFRMNPDGTGLELLYGALSHDTGTDGGTVQFVQPREMPDGRIMAVIKPFTGTDFGGDIVIIDTPNYVEQTQPTALNAGLLAGPAQSKAVINEVRTDTLPSMGGRFSSAYPLWDGTDRVLVSWSQCRLLEGTTIVPCTPDRMADPNAVPAPPLYGIWIYDMSDDTQRPIVQPVEGIMYTDIVAAQPRTLPGVIIDKTIGVDLDPDLAAEAVGVLNIRSVYDIDGVDVVDPNIATLADPAQATADMRPARFLKIVKAVSIPDDDIVDLPGTAFGRSAQQGMREILLYAPIEPDGSVKVKVPANVAFAVSVLDKDGRRITARHRNWLQLRPGQVMECNGCHDPLSGLSHGRKDSFDSAYAGAQVTGEPFPNTDPVLFADFGETMAEVRARVSCATDCAAMDPSVDLVYEDVWTHEPTAGREPDTGFAYRYADLTTTVPTGPGCLTNWSSGCRIVINYPTHIHPLWETPRQVLDADGVMVLEDYTCTNCHNTRDLMGNLQVPEGQLDLTGGPSTDEPDHLTSYRELLFADNAQELVQGALQDQAVQIGVDPDTGAPILAPVIVNPSMSVGGARASATFFSRFDAGGSHENFLFGDAEKRLVAEWLDIGAQYYNNPFDVPVN